MRKHNISKAAVEYCGSGDDGGIQDMYLYKDDGKDADFPSDELEFTKFTTSWKTNKWYDEESKIKLPFRKALEQHCYDLIQSEHAGWENNDGGSGVFEFDVAANKISWQHTQFIMSEQNSDYEV